MAYKKYIIKHEQPIYIGRTFRQRLSPVLRVPKMSALNEVFKIKGKCISFDVCVIACNYTHRNKLGNTFSPWGKFEKIHFPFYWGY